MVNRFLSIIFRYLHLLERQSAWRRCYGWNCYYEGHYLEKYCWSSFSPELQEALRWSTLVGKICFVSIIKISPFGLYLSEFPVTPLTELDEKDRIWPFLHRFVYDQETILKGRLLKRNFHYLEGQNDGQTTHNNAWLQPVFHLQKGDPGSH